MFDTHLQRLREFVSGKPGSANLRRYALAGASGVPVTTIKAIESGVDPRCKTAGRLVVGLDRVVNLRLSQLEELASVERSRLASLKNRKDREAA